MIENLRADLSNVRSQIASAEQRDQQLAGGLVKTLIAVQLEVLRTTEALIVQRIHALEANAPVVTVVPVCETNPARAQQIAGELVGLNSKLRDAEERASRYAGGLVKAMAESEIATIRNTIAMLEQQYMGANYGIAIPTAPVPGSRDASSPASSSPASRQQPAGDGRGSGGPIADAAKGEKDDLEIEGLDSRLMTVNDTYGELAWKVVLKNPGADARAVRVRFAVLDADEFELDYDTETGVVPPLSSHTIRGKILLDCAKIDRIASNAARVTAD